MLVRNLTTGLASELGLLFPNITFAYGIPSDEFLTENNLEIVRPTPPPPYVPSQAEIEQMIKTNVDKLWKEATEYQESFISGAALSLLTLGVLQSKPKSLAIMGWIQDIWNNHYYVQKPLVTENYVAYDFTVCGEMPYSVPELSAEVLG